MFILFVSAEGRDKDDEAENLLLLTRELVSAKQARLQLLRTLSALEKFYEQQYNDVLIVARVRKASFIISFFYCSLSSNLFEYLCRSVCLSISLVNYVIF